MSLNSNLQIDQVLQGTKFTENKPRIYATGVYLVPMKIFVKGTEQFVWVADDFKDESFDSGGNVISPKVIVDNVENLYDD
jgi:hypothetical protein